MYNLYCKFGGRGFNSLINKNIKHHTVLCHQTHHGIQAFKDRLIMAFLLLQVYRQLQAHLQVVDDTLHQDKGDIVAVLDVDVGGGFAQLDARDCRRLRLLFARAVWPHCSLHPINELLLLAVPRRARRPRVCIHYLLQHFLQHIVS